MKCSLKVYFDGACPLCRREIDVYRGLTPRQPVEYVDVSCPDGPLPDGLDRKSAMTRFHVTLPDGSLVSGARAFFELWSRFPYWRWLAKIRNIPGVPWLCERMYRLFLRWRPSLQRTACRIDD